MASLRSSPEGDVSCEPDGGGSLNLGVLNIVGFVGIPTTVRNFRRYQRMISQEGFHRRTSCKVGVLGLGGGQVFDPRRGEVYAVWS